MQCSFRSLCISPLHRKFPLPLPYSTLVVFTTCLGLGFDDGLKKSPTDPLRPIIPDDTCILCITTTVDLELIDAYSLDTFITSSSRAEVHDP